MLKGSILHEMLHAFTLARMLDKYPGPDPWEVLAKYEKDYRDLFIEEQEEWGNVPEQCASIFEAYIRQWRGDGMRYEESEAFVATDLAEDQRFVGIIDKVAVDKDGRRWLMDHKFVRSIPGPQDRFSEIQLLLYIWVRERWKKEDKIDGLIWDYSRTKVPVEPEVLKNGELSQRKNMDTTARVYRETIKKHGLKERDYRDMLKHLEGKEDTFFQRVPLPRPSEKMITLVVEDFRTTATKIQKLKGIAERNMTPFNCNTCEFRPLCETEVRGGDAKFVRENEYEPRREHGDEDGREAE